MFLKHLAGAITACLLITGVSQANDQFLDLAELTAFDEVAYTGALQTLNPGPGDLAFSNTANGDERRVTGNLNPSPVGPNTVGTTVAYVGTDVTLDSGTTTLSFGLENNNDDIWEFDVWIAEDGETNSANFTVGGTWVSLFTVSSGNSPNSTVFTIDVAGIDVDLDGDVRIGFAVSSAFDGQTTVGQTTPSNNGDNWVVDLRPVPEPGTIALLGAGMVAFAVARRRRRS